MSKLSYENKIDRYYQKKKGIRKTFWYMFNEGDICKRK